MYKGKGGAVGRENVEVRAGQKGKLKECNPEGHRCQLEGSTLTVRILLWGRKMDKWLSRENVSLWCIQKQKVTAAMLWDTHPSSL